MNSSRLNQYAEYLIRIFEQTKPQEFDKGTDLNPIVTELASWYEKIRNVIEYREEEVILRASIERVLKRRLILGGNGKSVAKPLLRELVWARYFPEGSIDEETTAKVEEIIDIYLILRKSIIQKHQIKESEATKWTFQLMSAAIENLLNPNIEKETMQHFIFHILKQNVVISDDSEETRDIQVYIAVQKAYAKNDLALLRYNLFKQFFPEITRDNIEQIADEFKTTHDSIERQLNYPLRHRIYFHVKKEIPAFLILEDILRNNKGRVKAILEDENELKNTILATCQKKYQNISGKVRRAIIRSVVFIVLSKLFFAFAIEGTYENLVYGKIMWGSITLNVIIPSFLMIAVSFFIRTPGHENSKRILHRIDSILFSEEPKVGKLFTLKLRQEKQVSFLNILFDVLWPITFILSFGLIIFILSKLNFNVVSQAVFIFFLAIVSFLAYRINQIAHQYTVEDSHRLLTPIIDFFFMPIARVGRYLTEGIAQVNIFLFILDFIIETPFKGLVSFFEQWFLFLHRKREDLG